MIDQSYLAKESITAIKKAKKASETSSVRLNEFLERNEYLALSKKVSNFKFSKSKEPLKFSFSTTKSKIPIPNQLSCFLKKITNKSFTNFSIKKFSHRDFTLIHDFLLPKKNQTKVFFFITKSWNVKSGGNFVILKKESSYLFPPLSNSLIILNIEKNQKYFVQYINHLAKNKSFYLLESTSK